MTYLKAIICNSCRKTEFIKPNFPGGNVTHKRKEILRA